MIEEVRIERLKLPLKEPYKLALGAVTAFDTILVHIVLAGREGSGEATILTGYTDETIEDAWKRAQAFAPLLPGTSADAARARIAASLPDAPFTATAFVSAIEMAEGHPILAVEKPEGVPLLFGVNATDPAGIEREIAAATAAGFGALKIKAGFDVEADLKRVAFIQRCNAGRTKLRIDANQGYGREDAVRFCTSLAPDDIELLEQPCDADDWDAAAAAVKVSKVPLMLDESIYDLSDIERAAAIGAAFVKLKLMKMGGLTPLIQGIERIRALGMEPVLGNGVASDLGCWMEACVARRHVRNAGEMNGFLRQKTPLAVPPLQLANGSMRLPGSGLALNEERVREATVEQLRAGKSTLARQIAS